LSIPQGKIIGILGPNGSGKTTTFKCILNLIHFNGSIKLSGVDNQNDPEEAMKKIGAIIEEPCFYGNLSGYKN
ncbi:ATP-binding cassette domain-containing protein, partial [Pseudomonas aeruginosa]